MSVPSFVKGGFFAVAVSLDGGNTFIKLCGLNSRNLTEAYQTQTEYIPDCNDPTAAPFQIVNVTGVSFDIAGTGIYNRAQQDTVRQLGGKSLPYRFIAGEDANDPVDSGYYQGNWVLNNRQIGAADGANVTEQMSWQSDGQIIFVPGADIIVLDPLSLNPRTATHAVAWTGTLSGTTTGSTVTATSSDSTTVTVSGTGNTRTLTATFAAAGNKTLTITETLTGASNTPKVTSIIVAVA